MTLIFLGFLADLSSNKGIIYAIGSSYTQLFNASGACLFASIFAGRYFPLVKFISAVTGWDFTAADILTVGRRIQTLRQLFNIRKGLSAKDFYLPDRIKNPLLTGPCAGVAIDFDVLRSSHYEAMDWDSDTGRPKDQTFQQLGLTL